MRFLRIVTNLDDRPRAAPDPEQRAKARRTIDDDIASGKLIATGGIGKRATAAARITSRAGAITVEDPPAGEGWMSAGGYSVFEADSKDDAIARSKATLEIMGDGVVELIQVTEMYPRGGGIGLVPDAIRVFVTDLDAAQVFYRQTLELTLRGGSTELGFLVFAVGSLSVILETVNPSDDEGRGLVGRVVGFSFRVPDIHATCQELLRRGVHFTGTPERQPWGGTLAHFHDCAKNVLTLVEHPKRPKQ
jgi:predicted enzyme related to lactoylglutathione lyase